MKSISLALPELPKLSLPGMGSDDDDNVELTPELQESLIRSTGGKVMSGIESVGNLLGVPGSMALDALAWKNPIDQLLTPFSSENRTTGRDLLRKYGLASKRDTWGNWAGGLATEIALDPFLWWSGVGALTKAGKVAKASGLLDNLATASAKKLGRTKVGSALRPAGSLRSKMKLTPSDLLDAIEDPVSRKDALDAFYRAGGTQSELQEKLGSLTGLRSPFGTLNIGKEGGRAENIAGYLDDKWETLRHGKVPGTEFSPGNWLSQLLYHRTKGFKTEEVQRAVESSAKNAERKAAKSKGWLGWSALKLHRAGLESPDSGKMLRDVVELGANADPITKEVAADMAAHQKQMLQEGLEYGTRDKGELTDVIQYSERHQGVQFTRPKEKTANPLSGTDPQDKNRYQIFKGFTGGTNRLNVVMGDDTLHSLVEAGVAAKTPKEQTIATLASEIENGYGSEIFPYYVTRGANDSLKMRRMKTTRKGLAGRLNKGRYGKGVQRGYETSQNDFVVRVDQQGNFLNFGNRGRFVQVKDMDEIGWSDRDVVVHSYKVPNPAGGTTTKHAFYKPQLSSRYKGLAEAIYDNPQYRGGGIFTNHPLFDMAYRTVHHNQRVENAKTVYQLVNDYAMPAPEGFERKGLLEGTATKDVLHDLGLNVKAGARMMMKMRGMDPTQMSPADVAKVTKSILHSRLPEKIVKDLRIISPAYRLPDPDKVGFKMMDSLTNLFKAGVLNWPARYVRDVMSGTIRNIEKGWVHPRDFADFQTITRGGVVQDAHEIPIIKDWLAARGIAATPDNGTDAIRTLYLQEGPGAHSISTDVTGAAESATGTLSDLTKAITGREKKSVGQSVKEIARTAVAKEPGTDWWPHHIRGFGDISEPTFGPAVAGERIGRYTDDVNRLVPFLHQLRQGVDPHQAMRDINFAQADYNPAHFTPTERQLKRVFPFYSFFRSQALYLANEMLKNPGGALAQSIRATKSLRQPGELTPDYVAETVSIPLGQTSTGDKSYLTGFGLMHEDPLSFFGGGPSGLALEAISRTNPLIKMGIELGTKQATHQKGPLGGRPLEDLDPTWGRIFSNISDMATGGRTGRIQESAPARAAEFLLASSPLARVGTTLRTATDLRKWEQPWKLVANLLSGVRVSDISPGAQEAILRERLEKVMKGEYSAKQFLKTYIPKDELAKMTPKQRQAALQVKALIDQLAKNATIRKKAEEEAKSGKKSSKKINLSLKQLPKLELSQL